MKFEIALSLFLGLMRWVGLALAIIMVVPLILAFLLFFALLGFVLDNLWTVLVLVFFIANRYYNWVPLLN